MKGGEYKPSIRTIRNNTGSNIYAYKTKCCQLVLKIYTTNETAVKQDSQTKTLCIGPCVVCPLGARNPKHKNARNNIAYLLADHTGTGLP
jgi:hypothetical protein